MVDVDIPFHQRLTCTTRQGCQAAGWGLTKMWGLIRDHRIETRTVDGHCLIVVASLLRLLDLDQAPKQPEPARTRATPPKAKRPKTRARRAAA